ncbi:MAG TPA: hypothetical protein VNT32_06395 [Thermoleophilaceae bacterium]|nr:hypothetical protein [Thermoleophilaceae bacterium]
MKKAGAFGVALALALPGTALAGTVGSGHIAVGSPHTSLISVGEVGIDGVDSFFLSAPAAGTTITTQTVDHSELGYDLDFYFFAADGSYVDSDCQTAQIDETCVVPAGAADVEVAAYFGADLDVTVVTVP